jgi:hypothetical protein
MNSHKIQIFIRIDDARAFSVQRQSINKHSHKTKMALEKIKAFYLPCPL